MSSSNEYKLNNLITIELYILLILIKASLEDVFIDIKKLSIYNYSYFVVLDTGLYLYDFNSEHCSLIHKFNKNEFKVSDNKLILKEFKNGYKAYIICLINEYLFIFNEYTYTLFDYKLNEINSFGDNYYNLMPLKAENNNISFIIGFYKDIETLGFYFYNYNLDEDIVKNNQIFFDKMNINNKMVRCQNSYNSTFIICFYDSKDKSLNYFTETIFYIKDMNLIKGKTTKIIKVNDNIVQIKMVVSYNDKFFVCIKDNTSPKCYINESLYKFNEIDCDLGEKTSPLYKIFYFTEIDDFMFVSIKHLVTTLIRNIDSYVKACKEHYFSIQYNDYSIIYTNNYQLVNFTNFSNYKKCSDISILKSNKKLEYSNMIKLRIKNSQNNNELSLTLNELIKDILIINYIDEIKGIIVPKDEMIISFISTYIEKMNENERVTTINFGKCEKKLKEIYNISEESNLYLLKVDKELEGKNFPQIEYEVFYPLKNGKIEILDLNLCQGINIELAIPVIINETIDKHNPKSNYYNDICSKASSKNNTDITLYDRRNEFIKNNMSLCEDNCELIDYDTNNKKAKCSCEAKTLFSLENMEFNGKKLLKNFLDIKKITNIEIIKCYKIVFRINNLKKNYGFFIFIFIFVLYFICLNIFCCKSWKSLLNEILSIIKKNNVINKINSSKNVNIINKRNIQIIKKRNEKIKINNNINFQKIKNKSSILRLKENKNKKNTIKNNKEIINKKTRRINLEYTDSELNSLSYKNALNKDKRTYCEYYISLLKKKESILFSFYPNKDYNPQIIKSFLFFFFYSSDITINALFFNDESMHKIYTDSGKFNLSYQLPQIIYSFLISYIINIMIEYLSLSEDSVISIKNNKNKKIRENKKIIKCIQTRFVMFFIITFLLLLIFSYYISCFCCIYENTQLHLIKDSLSSLLISLIYPIFINLIPGIFRICALRSKQGDKSCIYKLSKFIEFF